MSAASVLADLDAAGATVAVEGDRLRLRAPRGVLTDALHARIDAHREEIVAALAARRVGDKSMDGGEPHGCPETPCVPPDPMRTLKSDALTNAGPAGRPLIRPARCLHRLMRSDVCLDCGGPCPADGMHWCGECRAPYTTEGTAP